MNCLEIMIRHAGLDPASRACSDDWIPAFAGMTAIFDPNSVSVVTDVNGRVILRNTLSPEPLDSVVKA
jgi:hypothetical protein